MEISARISPLPPELRSQDFAFLRTKGIEAIQALAGDSWTDHNLHDPGITLMEALCYALTEAGLKAGMDVRDLLASSGVHRKPEFFTAAEVLPAAPVTVTDLRKILIDHPQVANAWLFPLLPAPKGRYSVLLEFSDDSLNSNTFVYDDIVTPSGSHTVDLAFPHWDDEEALPLQEDVALQSVAFSGSPGNEWNNIEGSASFYTRVEITYQPPAGGSQVMQLWIVAQIVDQLEDPDLDTPLILQEVITRVSTLGDNSQADQSILNQLNRRITAAYEQMRLIRRYALPYRNLCEDIVEFKAVRLQEVAVSAIIEVGSGVNIEDLLAEIFVSVDNMISPTIQANDLDVQLQETGGSADVAFDGPLTDSGFLTNIGFQPLTHTIYTSDVLRLIYQLRKADGTDILHREKVSSRKIVSVRSLALSNYLDNRPITTGARDCLQLVNSQRHVPRLSLTKSHIVIYRNGVEIDYNRSRVLEIFNARKLFNNRGSVSQPLDLPVPPGEVYATGNHYPLQNDLPLVYGVGEAGLPEQAPESRRGQASQLKGYLFLFEQLLAGYQAQLAHINSFFSADPEIDRTLFQQTLYHLPEIAPLFKAYDAQTITWSSFQEDETNAYAQALRGEVETREQFLSRRNAVLDHLLATLGEDMQERAVLLFRLATQIPGSAAMLLLDLLQAQELAKLEALEELIEDKSAYYYDVPKLNRDKGQAYGHPFWRTGKFSRVTAVANGYDWEILNRSGQPLFRQFTAAASPAAASRAEATRTAEQVMKLATEAERFTIRTEPDSTRRLEVHSSAGAVPLGESVATYPDDPTAQAAILETRDIVLEIWAMHSLIPLEWRLYHLLGINLRERRRLVHTTADYIEIFDEPDADPLIEKRFRLWELSGFGGDELLASVDNYSGPTDAEATAAAQEAIELMIDYGADIRNYRPENLSPGVFQVALVIPGGTALARSPATFASTEAAEAEINRIRDHIYGLFSVEGCYLLEHHLLFPPNNAGTALQIQKEPGSFLENPYSFQVSVLLPSGYGKDFSDENSVPEPLRPALYRNEEFRKYAEQQIRKYCPAQVLPRVLWVHRVLPGTPSSAADPSLDAFEQAYFNWLGLYLRDEVDETLLEPARDALTEIVNSLYQEYYAE